jgi:hypothetical protein
MILDGYELRIEKKNVPDTYILSRYEDGKWVYNIGVYTGDKFKLPYHSDDNIVIKRCLFNDYKKSLGNPLPYGNDLNSHEKFIENKEEIRKWVYVRDVNLSMSHEALSKIFELMGYDYEDEPLYPIELKDLETKLLDYYGIRFSWYYRARDYLWDIEHENENLPSREIDYTERSLYNYFLSSVGEKKFNELFEKSKDDFEKFDELINQTNHKLQWNHSKRNVARYVHFSHPRQMVRWKRKR